MQYKLQVSSAAPLLIVLMLPVFISACGPTDEDIANGDDPIAALNVTAQSTRYASDFWVREHERNPDRFQEAVAFCEGKEYADFPNCRAVAQAKGVVEAADSPRQEGKTYTGTENPFAADSTESP